MTMTVSPQALPALAPQTSPQLQPVSRPRLGPSHVLLVLFLCGVFLYINHRPLWHTDIWGHLKFGHWISTHQQLPTISPFLAETDQTTPLVHFSWLAQVLFFQVFQGGDTLAGEAGGIEALRTLHALLVAVRMLLLFWAFVLVGRSSVIALLGVVLVIVLGLPSIEVLRPQVWAEVFFAIMLVALSRPRLSTFAFFGLPLLLVLWSFVHGSFMIGLLVMGGANGGQFLQACRDAGGVHLRAVWGYEPFRKLFSSIMLSMLLIGLFHPTGFGVMSAAVTFNQHPAVAMMDEWQPLAWDTPWGLVFFLSLLFVLVTFLAGMYLLPRQETTRMLLGGIPLGQVLLLLFFGLRTVGCQRFMLWWIILTVWISMSVWGPLWRHYAPNFSWQPRPGQALITMIVLGVVTFLFSGVGLWLLQGETRPMERALHPATPWPLARQLREPDTQAFPPIQRWLQRYRKEQWSGRIFTTETLGEYLLWSLPKEQAPLLFTHVHLFPAAHWHTCMQVRAGAGDWETALERMGATMIVVEAEHHSELRRQLLSEPYRQRWDVLLDETGDKRKSDPRSRWLIAVRRP